MLLTTLVNKDNKIKESYFSKINLIQAKDISNKEVLVEEKTYEAFFKLQAFLQSKNIIIGLSSAYRSLDEQENLYQDFVNKYGKDYALKTVAHQGYSEHHTGLAIDFDCLLDDHFPIDNNEALENISLYEEVHKYLADFGFILRYPKGKEEITKYSYEPWHIRYVGEFIAKIIAKKTWTLEEYLTNFSGIIVVNKEKSMTSFDVVHEISHLFGLKRVGHTGTLDPLAEGVLIVAIGKATKVVELLTSYEKEYIASVKLGLQTDTLDITGKVIATAQIENNLNIEEALNHFKTTYLQEVPIYSAVKVNGKKLYQYARENKSIILPKKEVTIKEITLLSKKKDTFTFKALVSKGCYIRSLINDICSYLNTLGTMTSLIRTKQGSITLEDAFTLDDIKMNNYKLLDVKDILNYPTITVNKDLAFKIKNGQVLDNLWNVTSKVIFEDEEGNLLGIYEVNDKKLKVWKNF